MRFSAHWKRKMANDFGDSILHILAAIIRPQDFVGLTMCTLSKFSHGTPACRKLQKPAWLRWWSQLWQQILRGPKSSCPCRWYSSAGLPWLCHLIRVFTEAQAGKGSQFLQWWIKIGLQHIRQHQIQGATPKYSPFNDQPEAAMLQFSQQCQFQREIDR